VRDFGPLKTPLDDPNAAVDMGMGTTNTAPVTTARRRETLACGRLGSSFRWRWRGGAWDHRDW